MTALVVGMVGFPAAAARTGSEPEFLRHTTDVQPSYTFAAIARLKHLAQVAGQDISLDEGIAEESDADVAASRLLEDGTEMAHAPAKILYRNQTASLNVRIVNRLKIHMNGRVTLYRHI